MMDPYNPKTFDIRLVVTLLIITMLPSFIFVAYGASSLALGGLISSSLILMLNYNLARNIRFNKARLIIFILVSVLLFMHSSYIFIFLSISKPFYSLIIVLIVISALVLTSKIEVLDFKTISNSILVTIIALLFLGWIRVFYIPDCCNYIDYEKPVFPFSEESHYGLVLGMLSVAFAAAGSLIWGLFIACNIFILGLVFPNLVLMVCGLLVIFACLLRLKPVYFKLTLLFLPMFILLVLFGLSSGSEYFSSRLTFVDATNLTALVYLQGWDLAYVNLVETKGMGLGFQMLGSSFASESQFTQEIIQATGKSFNLSDGGFLASKIISELGVIGVMLLLCYFLCVLRLVFYGNKIWSVIHSGINNVHCDFLKKRLLASGVVLGFFVEIFLRGYGYFSPGVFLFLAAVFYLLKQRKSRLKLLL